MKKNEKKSKRIGKKVVPVAVGLTVIGAVGSGGVFAEEAVALDSLDANTGSAVNTVIEEAPDVPAYVPEVDLTPANSGEDYVSAPAPVIEEEFVEDEFVEDEFVEDEFVEDEVIEDEVIEDSSKGDTAKDESVKEDIVVGSEADTPKGDVAEDEVKDTGSKTEDTGVTGGDVAKEDGSKGEVADESGKLVIDNDVTKDITDKDIIEEGKDINGKDIVKDETSKDVVKDEAVKDVIEKAPDTIKDEVKDIINTDKPVDKAMTEKTVAMMKEDGFNEFLTNTMLFTAEEKQGLSQDQVMNLYDKYLAKYRDADSDKLFIFDRETYNADGSLSAESKQQALDIINFMRELAGMGTVVWDDTYDMYAQAGTDFLVENNLEIAHDAATGSGNDNAITGLSRSNLARGSGYYNLFDLLFGMFGDDDDMNRGVLGHRAWLFNSTASKMGIGASRGNMGTYLAIYIGDRTGGYDSDEFTDMNGSIPKELIDEIRTSDSYPWMVGVGKDVDSNSDVTVTITDEDRNVYVMNSRTESTDKVLDDWFSLSYNSIHYTVNINPAVLYRLFGYDGLVGKSFTVNISGLKSAKGVLKEDINYTVNFFSLFNALQQREVDREVIKDFVTGVGDIPTDLSWEDYETIKGMKDAYDKMSDSQKALLSADVIQKMNDAYATADGLHKQYQADVVVANGTANIINSIGTVSLSSDKAITGARKAYDALTESQKALVDPAVVVKLQEAETKYQALVAKDKADKEAVSGFTGLSNLIPEVVSLDDKDTIAQVRAAYDALTDDQKALVGVDALSRLTGAEAQVKALEVIVADKVETAKVEGVINGLSGTVSLSDEASVLAARAAFNSLTAKQKEYMNSNVLQKLLNAEQRIAEIKLENKTNEEAADMVEEAIKGIDDEVDLTDESSINSALALYNSLTEAQLKLLDPAMIAKLKGAQDTIVVLKEELRVNMEQAKEVEGVINGLSNNVTLSDEASVNSALAEYNALSDTVKKLVGVEYFNKLQNAVNTISALKVEQSNKEEAKKVENAIQGLPELDKITLGDRDTVLGVQALLNGLTDVQKAYVGQDYINMLTNLLGQFVKLEAKVVDDKIASLPDDITIMDGIDIKAVRAAYDALSADAKLQVNPSFLAKLVSAEARIVVLEKEAAVAKEVDNMEMLLTTMKAPADLTLEDEAYLNTMVYNYTNMSAEAKALVDQALVAKLTDCINRMDELKNPIVPPVDPDEPVNPDEPVDPDQPIQPDQPDQPVQPDTPVTNPENPNTPGNAPNQDNTNQEIGSGTSNTPVSYGSANNGKTESGSVGSDAKATNNGSPNTGIENDQNGGFLAGILAFFGIGGTAVVARKRRKNR